MNINKFIAKTVYKLKLSKCENFITKTNSGYEEWVFLPDYKTNSLEALKLIDFMTEKGYNIFMNKNSLAKWVIIAVAKFEERNVIITDDKFATAVTNMVIKLFGDRDD